jgi:hypothetical protein
MGCSYAKGRRFPWPVDAAPDATLEFDDPREDAKPGDRVLVCLDPGQRARNGRMLDELRRRLAEPAQGVTP